MTTGTRLPHRIVGLYEPPPSRPRLPDLVGGLPHAERVALAARHSTAALAARVEAHRERFGHPPEVEDAFWSAAGMWDALTAWWDVNARYQRALDDGQPPPIDERTARLRDLKAFALEHGLAIEGDPLGPRPEVRRRRVR